MPMNLIDILSREHKIFLGILGRMEKSFKYDEATARRELRDAFLTLLPALQKHEEIEALVFRPPERASGGPAKRLSAEIEAQHRQIEALRGELQKALAEAGSSSFERLKFLAFEIEEKLRLHFRTEETRLWPNYRLAIGRWSESEVARRALRQVGELERCVAQNRVLIAEYLGGTK